MRTVASVLELLGHEPPPAWPTGAPERELRGSAALGAAGPDDLSFATGKAVSRQPDQLRAARAGLVLAAAEAAELLDETSLVLVVENPRLAFVRVVGALFAPPRPEPGVHPSAQVDDSAEVAPDAHIGALCAIGAGSVVGPGCVLHPSVTLYPGVRLGQRVQIHSGSVLGGPGFGYERDEAGVLVNFPQLGGVIVEDDVEIGSNTCIDCGALDDTVIGARSRIDNLVHIAHGVKIGQDCAVIAHAEISGSCVIGDRAWIAPGALVLESVSVGEDALVGLGAVVIRPVEAGTTVVGNPAKPLGRAGG